MLIEKDYQPEDELPYRIEIDNLRGAGISPCRAVMAALSVGKKIPVGTRNTEEAIKCIYQEQIEGNYGDSGDWKEIIKILEKNTF